MGYELEGSEGFAESCEAKDITLSSTTASAKDELPCGKPQGFLAKKDQSQAEMALPDGPSLNL